ncbi:22244_t:CDS:2 [Racocetra persica]|uniref:22244_t:CDS:1 n=1 Tax=Racocetra persica TaxID=160502 RepID=A0ACA9L9U3_9GLOM|nr:22244_t:CDS:2 [Racocetra persica]
MAAGCYGGVPQPYQGPRGGLQRSPHQAISSRIQHALFLGSKGDNADYPLKSPTRRERGFIFIDLPLSPIQRLKTKRLASKEVVELSTTNSVMMGDLCHLVSIDTILLPSHASSVTRTRESCLEGTRFTTNLCSLIHVSI